MNNLLLTFLLAADGHYAGDVARETFEKLHVTCDGLGSHDAINSAGVMVHGDDE